MNKDSKYNQKEQVKASHKLIKGTEQKSLEKAKEIKKKLNCNISSEKSNLPKIGDYDKLISKLLLKENTTSRVETGKDVLKIVKWNFKKNRKRHLFSMGV